MDAGEQDKKDGRTLAQPSRPYSFHQPTVEEAAYGHETGDAGEGIGEQLRQFEHVEKYLLDGGDEAHKSTHGDACRNHITKSAPIGDDIRECRPNARQADADAVLRRQGFRQTKSTPTCK